MIRPTSLCTLVRVVKVRARVRVRVRVRVSPVDPADELVHLARR